MTVRWKGLDPNVLAGWLEEIKEEDPHTGEVRIPRLELRRVAAALHASVDFSEKMPEAHERGIVYRAADSVARSGTVTSGRLLRAIGEGAERFLRRSGEDYVLVTSVSVRHFPELGAETVTGEGGAEISFDRYLPEEFRGGHENARERGSEWVVGRLPSPYSAVWTYTPVRVRVRGKRSHEEAVEAALDALDLVRGAWNLAINRGVGGTLSAGVAKPVNKAVLGPVHSLHHPDGGLADADPWLENGYAGTLRPYRLTRRWDEVRDYATFVQESLPTIPYRGTLEEAIRRYCRALDRRDWHTSFVRLWGVLELLTDTYRHNLVVDRVLPLFRQRYKGIYGQFLKQASLYRNDTVHRGTEGSSVRVLLYDLQRYARLLLEYHLSARPVFSSVCDAARFLDGADEEAVERRISPDAPVEGAGNRATEGEDEGPVPQ